MELAIEIICTIGPKTLRGHTLKAMRGAGMTMVRLNGVHADIAWHTDAITYIRKTVDVPIMFDLPTFRKARWQTKAGQSIKDKGKMIGPQDGRRVELARQCEYVALSYVESEVEILQSPLPQKQTIAKIETAKGVNNAHQLQGSCARLLLDRRDLAVDVGAEYVPQAQDMLGHGHFPLLVASEFLTSMLYKPYPSMADIANVHQIVQQRVLGLVLSEETAIGDHPVESVEWVKRITGAAK